MDEQGRAERLDDVAPWRRRLDEVVLTAAEAGALWVAAHWLFAMNLVTGLVLAGAYAAPLLELAGATGASSAIHTWYLLLCPQRPGHSYFPWGRQTALEHREIAMFAGQLAAGLVYALRRGGQGLPWWGAVLLSLPLAWDGFSQMFGFRDSDWLTRTWTGALFSVGLVFWLYPFMDRLVPPFLRPSARRPAGIVEPAGRA